MSYQARKHVLEEATYKQLLDLKPNMAVVPWGATEAHNYHMPHGTDNYQATFLANQAVANANSQGARCIALPCVPFGNNNTQLSQAATITMRTSTQQQVLYDIADSLVRQGIDRLLVMNFHGGNEFKPLVRDVMLDLPIFIVVVNGHQLAPAAQELLDHREGDHADEFETSLMLHLKPEIVAPLDTAGDGAVTTSKLPHLSTTPGVWAPRNWAATSKDTGIGDPSKATAAKGEQIFKLLVDALTPVLLELSNANEGDYPFIIESNK